jgi:hypothetical protein
MTSFTTGPLSLKHRTTAALSTVLLLGLGATGIAAHAQANSPQPTTSSAPTETLLDDCLKLTPVTPVARVGGQDVVIREVEQPAGRPVENTVTVHTLCEATDEAPAPTSIP